MKPRDLRREEVNQLAQTALWVNLICRGYEDQINRFAKAAQERMGSFRDIEEERTQIETDAHLELGKMHGYGDPSLTASLAGTYAEQARAGARAYRRTEQRVITVFAVGLWHFFEQQLAHFIRTELRDPGAPMENLDFWKAKVAALSKAGIEISAFRSYSGVDELRLVANCAKHGEGKSCAQLREQRPDLFQPQAERGGGVSGRRRRRDVLSPLIGEDVYLTPEGFKQYVTAIGAFWSEMSIADAWLAPPKKT